MCVRERERERVSVCARAHVCTCTPPTPQYPTPYRGSVARAPLPAFNEQRRKISTAWRVPTGTAEPTCCLLCRLDGSPPHSVSACRPPWPQRLPPKRVRTHKTPEIQVHQFSTTTRSKVAVLSFDDSCTSHNSLSPAFCWENQCTRSQFQA